MSCDVNVNFLESLQDEAMDLSVSQLISSLGIKDVEKELSSFSGGSDFSFQDFLNQGFSEREALENVWVNNEFNRRAI